MPDTYVKLPNGQYVQIPEGASPEQLQQMKSRLVQMQSNVPDATAQAKQVLQKIPQYTSAAAGKEVNDPKNAYMRQNAPMMYAGAGGMAGGALAPAAAGLPAGIRALAMGSSVGAGAGVGQLALDPTNPGEALSTAAGTTMAATAIPPLAKWLTSSKSVGAKALQAASAKAGNAPVELSPKTNELIEEIVREGKSGGTVPKVVTDLLDRLGPSTRQAAEATPGPLTYNEARSFQSNLSQLSASEQMSLKGRMKSLIPEAAKSFAKDVQAGANAAGAGPEHAIGMREYAQASSRNRVLMKTGKAVGIGGGIAGTLYEIARMMQRSTP